MSTATWSDERAAKRASERHALDKMAERLATEHPGVPAEQITQAILRHHAQFDEAPIRDFVPVLVERAVKSDLNHP